MSGTDIAHFYQDRSVLITGSTGFLGKVLVEKLLRSCPGIRHIFLLIRIKRGVDVKDRLEAMTKCKLFDLLRQEQPDFVDKLVTVHGDMLEPNLGLSSADEQRIVDEVSIVFHSAATVKFDEPLKVSLEMNVCGVDKIVRLCKKLKHIDALVHVSTAYANCNRNEIEEKIYDPPVQPRQMLDALGWMDDAMLDLLTPRLIGDRPNTYTFTKAVAEALLDQEKGDIPCSVVRPSIVGASWKEPFPGWIDNFNGPTGLFAAIGKGILRIMKGNLNGTADVVPVDVAVNMLLAVGWFTGTKRPKETMVFNCTTGQINRFTWGQLERLSYECFMKNPLENVFRVPNPRFTNSSLWHDVNQFFDQMIPAYLSDLYMQLIGRRPMFVRIQQRLHRSVKSLDFFTLRQWHFSNENVFTLLNEMTTDDRKFFNFDVRPLHWRTYIESYCLGTKKFALKEDMTGMPSCRKHLRRLQLLGYAFNALLLTIVWRLLIAKTQTAKRLWYLLISLAVKFLKKFPKIARSS